MKVTFSNISRDERTIPFEGESVETRIRRNVEDVMNRKNFILGDYVERFERDFADYCGTNYCIGVGNGLSALEMSLKHLDLSENDEVITQANTFNATVAAIDKVRAKVVLVDVNYNNFNINPDDLKIKITEKTRAIVPVHLYGQLSDINKIKDIAGNIPIIEDACQAHGARLKEVSAGSFGYSGCFSFYPGKNLGGYGDGGAIVTDSEELTLFSKKSRNYGQSRRYFHDVYPDNTRLDTIQAAVLIEKLRVLDQWNNMRRENAEIYRKELNGLNEIQLPSESEKGTHVYHLFVIKAEKRDQLQEYLGRQDIETGKHYPYPIHLQTCFNHLGYKRGDFPISEELSGTILSLPIFPTMRESEIKYVCENIKNFYSKS